MDTNRAKVKSVDKAIRIIEALKEFEHAGVTEVAKHLDIPKSSAYNYLKSLEEGGYVISENERYRLSLKFLDLGAVTRKQQQIFGTSLEEIETLANETNELVNLAVEEQGFGVYLYRASGDREVPVDTRIGKHIHLSTTALGKSILAQYPRQRVTEILDNRGLPERTPNTITDRDVLFKELAEIKESDIAFDREERLEGIKCIATTIHDEHDDVIGAISISGPAHRMKGERFEEELPERILETSNLIELKAKYSGDLVH